MSDIGYIIIIFTLIGSNLLTIWFYTKQINVLIDKSMSKSYPEYIQAKNLEQGHHFPNGSTQAKPDIQDDEVLKELNQILS